MQISYNIYISISTYLNIASNNNWIFPNFNKKCPICGGKDCCVRIGFYYRYIYDSESHKLLYIPVARYLCRRKNKNFKNKKAHKTFSLLPSTIIPYHKYDIPAAIFIAEKRHKCEIPLLDIACEITVYFNQEDESCGISSVVKYLKLFDSGTIKLSSCRNNHKFNDLLFTIDFFNRIRTCISRYTQAFFSKYNQFIFGTPSQSR